MKNGNKAEQKIRLLMCAAGDFNDNNLRNAITIFVISKYIWSVFELFFLYKVSV